MGDGGRDEKEGGRRGEMEGVGGMREIGFRGMGVGWGVVRE